MKKITVIIAVLLTAVSVSAQTSKHSISLYGQQSFIGGSTEFDYNYSTGVRNKIYIGLRHRDFDVMHVTDSKEYVFQDRFHPKAKIQNYGLILGDEYSFKIPHSKLNPFLFYNLQIAYMGIHNEFMDPFGYSEDGYQIYINNPVDADPMFVFENNIGLGGKVRLYKKLDLVFRIGAGIAIINLTDENYRVPPDLYGYFSKMGSLGLSYHF